MEKFKNIIMFTVDKENMVRKILSKLFLATPIVSVIRLGKKKKSRPLQVNFTNKVKVLPIVKTKHKVHMVDTPKHILIGVGLTM